MPADPQAVGSPIAWGSATATAVTAHAVRSPRPLHLIATSKKQAAAASRFGRGSAGAALARSRRSVQRSKPRSS